MIFDLSLQQYVDWGSKASDSLKGKFGYRVF